MNKRGFLLAEETLKIILALIGISFLVLFLTSLYFTNIKQQKLEQAGQELKNSKESIQKIIASMGDEEREKNLVNPSSWFLFGFTGNEKPDSCSREKSCVCICDKFSYFTNPLKPEEKKQAERCVEHGTCLDVEGLESFSPIEIKNPDEKLTQILIKKESGKISISEIE